MLHSNHKQSVADQAQRRGAIAVLMAVCLVILLAVAALSVDIGWAALDVAELQNAADAAAAAGATALSQGYAQYSTTGQTNLSKIISTSESTAISWSQSYASYNGATDLSSLNLASSDIVFGYTDASGNYSTNFQGFPNTVTVTIRRDGTSNSKVPLFFGSIVGMQSLSQSATASATIYTGTIGGFNSSGGGVGNGGGYGNWGQSYSNTASSNSFNNLLLPVALDAVAWSNIVNAGVSPSNSTYASAGSSGYNNSNHQNDHCEEGDGEGWDGHCHWSEGDGCGSSEGGNWWDRGWNNSSDSCTSNHGDSEDDCHSNDTSTLADGTKEFNVFPCPSNFPGMFCTIGLDGSSTSDDCVTKWVQNGPSANDINSLGRNCSFPCSETRPTTCTGCSGISSSVASAFAGCVGQKRLLPIFQAASISPYQCGSGSGSNTQLKICGFVGVKITSVTGSGSSTRINIQPCNVVDPTAVYNKSSVVPCGCEPSSQIKTFSCCAPKICK